MTDDDSTWRSIDLHRMTWEEARVFLASEIERAFRDRHAHLCVIHGRGWHSEGNKAVLARTVREWLIDLETHKLSPIERVRFGEENAKQPNPGVVFVTLKLHRENPVFDPEQTDTGKRPTSRLPILDEIDADLPEEYLDELDEGMKRFMDGDFFEE